MTENKNKDNEIDWNDSEIDRKKTAEEKWAEYTPYSTDYPVW